MLSLTINNSKLENEFIEIVKNCYGNNTELALSDALEKFIAVKSSEKRLLMKKLVENFRETNRSNKIKSNLIEDSITEYRTKHEK